MSLNFRIFRFFVSMHGQHPISPPRLLASNKRFRTEIKTRWALQYWLPGFRSTAPGDNGNGSELDDLGRNFYPRFRAQTFYILARLRRMLRTTCLPNPEANTGTTIDSYVHLQIFRNSREISRGKSDVAHAWTRKLKKRKN